MESVLINDITLRDGEQAAGVNFFPEEKLKIAEQLVKLGVPIIEAGFPITSEQDAKGVELVAKEFGKHIIISAMCRAVFKDIEVAAKSLCDVPKRRIQVVMGTSDIHLKYKFNMSREQGLDTSVESVEYARKFSQDVEFAAEDSTRSDPDYLIKVCLACVKAGATTIELPDTVGYSTPEEYFKIINSIVKFLPQDIVVSTHCHNDLGLATANTLAGIQAGAKQAEVTINGIGERVGNASSEEVIMVLKTRSDFYKIDISYINAKEIIKTSKMIEKFSQINIAHNKAIVGKGAFLHESGIHQDGLIKSPQTYQLLNPQDIGLEGYQLVIGKLSGKNALKEKMNFLKIELDEQQMKDFSKFFKDNAAKKKFITDDDIVTLYKRWNSI
jgi:2-isopropylmalate synthase